MGATYPELAGKITGMLLEIDNSELVHMLEHQESLKGKVDEAVAVLQAHQNKEEKRERRLHNFICTSNRFFLHSSLSLFFKKKPLERKKILKNPSKFKKKKKKKKKK